MPLWRQFGGRSRVTRSRAQAFQPFRRRVEMTFDRQNVWNQQMEERMATFEYSASAQRNEKQEAAMNVLEFFLRHESLLQQLVGNCPPAASAAPSTLSTSSPPRDESPNMCSTSTSPQPYDLPSSSSTRSSRKRTRNESPKMRSTSTSCPQPCALRSTSPTSSPPRKRPRNESPNMCSTSTSSPQPCALSFAASPECASVASPWPIAPSPAVPSSSPLSGSSKDFILGEELLAAVEDGRVEDARRLVSQGVNVDYHNEKNQTALIIAAFNGEAEVMSLLLEQGANINAQSIEGATALHWASFNDHSGCCVKLLIDSMAQLQIEDRVWGQSALHWAYDSGNEEAVRLLIAAGASNAVKDETLNETERTYKHHDLKNT